MIANALPCPSCGGLDVRYVRNEFDVQCVCPHCLMRGPVSSMARRDQQTDVHFRQALEAWNRLPRRKEASFAGRCDDARWGVDAYGVFGCDERMFVRLGQPPIMMRRCIICGRVDECGATPACTFEYIAEFEVLLSWCEGVAQKNAGHGGMHP